MFELLLSCVVECRQKEEEEEEEEEASQPAIEVKSSKAAIKAEPKIREAPYKKRSSKTLTLVFITKLDNTPPTAELQTQF